MLKAGDLARQEDHRVRESKLGKPDEIGGCHMYAGLTSIRLKSVKLSHVMRKPAFCICENKGCRFIIAASTVPAQAQLISLCFTS